MESSGGVNKNYKKRLNKRNKKPESGERTASRQVENIPLKDPLTVLKEKLLEAKEIGVSFLDIILLYIEILFLTFWPHKKDNKMLHFPLILTFENIYFKTKVLLLAAEFLISDTTCNRRKCPNSTGDTRSITKSVSIFNKIIFLCCHLQEVAVFLVSFLLTL